MSGPIEMTKLWLVNKEASMKKASLIFLFVGLLFATIVQAAPSQVVIIRHGEKPASGNELSDVGWQRAHALPEFLGKFQKIAALYAGSPEKPGGSVRSIQTITPFSQKIGMNIHTEFTKKNLSGLVHAVMTNKAYDGRTIIICWEHVVIPDMVKLFGAVNAPSTWADDVFDRAWVLNFTSQGVEFEDIPEHVLPQDS
jgi:hypothetical protein